ncbi:prefoldin subunit 6, partial [Aspergillus nomiae NRRL 13137]
LHNFVTVITMADAQKQMQALSDEFQKLQTELDSFVEARQKLESQQQENQGVQKEFNSLDDDANIYKLIGPVLLKQDKNEALMAVNGRLEFIEKEIKRIEGQIKENQDKSDKMRAEMLQYQSQMQQQAAATSASA